MIRNYRSADEERLFSLWNFAGTKFGYAPVELMQFQAMLTHHRLFLPEHAFVLELDGVVWGFAVGCCGDHIPHGKDRGYISCVILDESAKTREHFSALVSALEDSFRAAGKRISSLSFFNPMGLPWVIPGTPGHQHNNMPGVPRDAGMFDLLLQMGYEIEANEIGLYLNLKEFVFPEEMTAKAESMAARGYRVARYDPRRHKGIEEMTAALGNPVWCDVIPKAGKSGMCLLVGLKDDTVAGFAGPIYPESTGRGYLDGLGVSPEFEGNGLGKLLFYRLIEEERRCGAEYMSIFTGEENPARFIYQEAGFEVRRKFSVMNKKL